MELMLTILLCALFVTLILVIIIIIINCYRLYSFRQIHPNKINSISSANNITETSSIGNMLQTTKMLTNSVDQDLTPDETNVLIAMIKARVKSLSMYMHGKNLKIPEAKTLK